MQAPYQDNATHSDFVNVSRHYAPHSNNLRQVYARTTLKCQCISIQSIKIWNSLDGNIYMFQRMYKKKVFRLYWSKNSS